MGKETEDVRLFRVVDVFELKLKYDQIPGRCRTSTLLDMGERRKVRRCEKERREGVHTLLTENEGL